MLDCTLRDESESHVLLDGKPGKQRIILEHHRSQGGWLRDPVPIVVDRPRLWRLNDGDTVQQVDFPTAPRPDILENTFLHHQSPGLIQPQYGRSAPLFIDFSTPKPTH